LSHKEMRVLCRDHFFDLLDQGHEEFRIKTITPGKNKREITEDAPFDRDDPMSYVLVNMIFDEIEVYAKGEFSSHDLAEAERVYGGVRAISMKQKMELMEKTIADLCKKAGVTNPLAA
jgi:hypothetical protein